MAWPPAAPPRSFLLLPDPTLTRAGDGIFQANGDLYAYAAAAAYPDGRYLDIAVPDEENRGAVQIVQLGTPTEHITHDFVVVASGGIWNKGTWAWKRTSDSEVTAANLGGGDDTPLAWRGANDARYAWAPHDPFQNDTAEAGRTIAIVYSKLLNKELLFRAAASSNIEVAYQSRQDHTYSAVSGNAAAWTRSSCIRTDTGLALQVPNQGAGTNAYALDVIELRDGTLMMALADNGNRDLLILHSTDGVNWTPVADNILARFGIYGHSGLVDLTGNFDMKRSGDYIRFCFPWFDSNDIIGAGAADWYVRTFVSSDRGSSWKEVSASLNIYYDVHDNRSGDHNKQFALGNLDDDAGTFMLLFRTDDAGATGYAMRVHSAAGMDGWQYRSTLDQTEGAAVVADSIGAVRGPDYLYIFSWLSGGAGTQNHLRLYMIDPRDPFNLDSWLYEPDVFKDAGANLFMVRNMKFANAGNNYLAMLAILYDPDDGYNDEENGKLYLRFGGWDTLPVEERDHPEMADAPFYRHQPGYNRGDDTGLTEENQLALITWDAWMGAPTPVGTANVASTTPWVRSAHSNTTQDWNTSRVKYTDVTGAASQWTNQYVDASTQSWFAATGITGTDKRCSAMLEVIAKVDQTGNATTSSDDIAVRLKSYDVTAGTGHMADLSLRLTATAVLLRDNKAGSTLVATNPSLSGFIKYRLGLLARPFESSDPISFVFWYRDEETAGSEWVCDGYTGTVSTAAGNTQSIEWGHITSKTPAADANRRISSWRRVALYGPHDGGATRLATDAWGDTQGGVANDDTRLDNLRGRAMTPDPVLVEKGVYAQIQGGAGFEGDSFTGKVNYSFHPRNMTMIDSPRIGFRTGTPSSGVTEVFIPYDAAHEESGRAFQHAYAAVYGYGARQISFLYSANSNFSSPTTQTLDLTLMGGVAARVATVGVGGVLISGSDPGCPPAGLLASSRNGDEGGPTYFMQVTAAACSTAVGKTWIVENEVPIAAGRIFNLGFRYAPALAGLVAAGASVVFYADRGILKYSAQTNARYMMIWMPATYTGYANQHRLGTVVIGNTLPFTTPLDWSHSDGEQGNTTHHTTRGGLRWGYREGPPQRVWEGLVVGDIASVRRRMRGYMRSLSGYDQRAVVLCTDDTDLLHAEKNILGTIRSGTEFQNEGWAWSDSESRWVPAGNMKLVLHEEV